MLQGRRGPAWSGHEGEGRLFNCEDFLWLTVDGLCDGMSWLGQLLDYGLAKVLPKNVNDRSSYVMTGEAGSLRYSKWEI